MKKLAVLLLMLSIEAGALSIFDETKGVFSYTCVLIKVDSSFNVLWSRYFEKGVFLSSGGQTPDGGYVFTGTTKTSNDSNYLLSLVKIDSNGNIIWSRNYENYEGAFDRVIAPTKTGNYFLFSNITFSDSVKRVLFDTRLIKVDSLGDTLWSVLKKGLHGMWLEQTNDGGCIIIGNHEEIGSSELTKFDPFGNIEWSQSYPNQSYSLSQTSDGGYIITGSERKKLLLLKVNSTGKKLWKKSWGSEVIDRGYCVRETQHRNYIVAGEIRNKFHLIKTNSEGKLLWKHNYSEEYLGWAKFIYLTPDERCLAIGNKEFSLWLLVTNEEGDVLCEIVDLLEPISSGYWIQGTTDGGYILLASQQLK